MDAVFQRKMTDAWQFVWGWLFDADIRLFYDYVTSRDHRRRFSALPHPDEIARQFPNPCGWGTGMEDSMLNAGTAMEMLACRFQVTSEPEPVRLAELLVDGMWRCSHVHGVPGFVARSISPEDRRSCYGNSSRDQFTWCVYGAWRFLRTFPGASPESRRQARQLLIDIAGYCEKIIAAPAGGNLLRLDGQPALVSEMVRNLGVHEVMRLPMFFAAAWEVTGDGHWFELYRRYAIPGIEQTRVLDPNLWWWDISLSQMQLSLALLAGVETERSLQDAYLRGMRETAELSERQLAVELERAENFSGGWEPMSVSWRTLPLSPCRLEDNRTPEASVLFGGYPYYNPRFPEDIRLPGEILRAAGNYVGTILLAPDGRLPVAMARRLAAVYCCPDYRTFSSGAAIQVLYGYWRGRLAGLW